MSDVFPYICTTQTVDAFVPNTARDLTSFARDVSDGFYALQGGYRRVGQLAFFPLQKAVPFHLLCNGQEVPKASFPELYDYLGDFEGAAADPANFKLPDYIGATAIAPAATAAAETVQGGTVTSETPTPGGGDSGGTIDKAVDSGGRVRRVLEP